MHVMCISVAKIKGMPFFPSFWPAISLYSFPYASWQSVKCHAAAACADATFLHGWSYTCVQHEPKLTHQAVFTHGFGVQVVALVGPSGGGKSSIVKLVERFYLPAAGAVRMDGRDVGSYDEKWLRRKVAIVSQEPVLYGRRSARTCDL